MVIFVQFSFRDLLILSMETEEELAKAWAKGQPGLGLYLGCRAVRRAGKGELTVVTVENVVDGMARVCEALLLPGEMNILQIQCKFDFNTFSSVKPITNANSD